MPLDGTLLAHTRCCHLGAPPKKFASQGHDAPIVQVRRVPVTVRAAFEAKVASKVG